MVPSMTDCLLCFACWEKDAHSLCQSNHYSSSSCWGVYSLILPSTHRMFPEHAYVCANLVQSSLLPLLNQSHQPLHPFLGTTKPAHLYSESLPKLSLPLRYPAITSLPLFFFCSLPPLTLSYLPPLGPPLPPPLLSVLSLSA
jgi:hypothetical protein